MLSLHQSKDCFSATNFEVVLTNDCSVDRPIMLAYIYFFFLKY